MFSEQVLEDHASGLEQASRHVFPIEIAEQGETSHVLPVLVEVRMPDPHGILSRSQLEAGGVTEWPWVEYR